MSCAKRKPLHGHWPYAYVRLANARLMWSKCPRSFGPWFAALLNYLPKHLPSYRRRTASLGGYLVARYSLSGGIGKSGILSPNGRKVSLCTVTYGLGRTGVSPKPYFHCQNGSSYRNKKCYINLWHSNRRRTSSHLIHIN